MNMRTYNRLRKARLRKKVLAERVLVNGRLTAPRGEHGTFLTYNGLGCRCKPCTAANTAQMAAYKARKRPQ